MVAGFRRSLSLPKARASVPEKSYHVRSISLPYRSHPIISHLEDEIRALRAWQSEPESGSLAWTCAGLARLQLLHSSLDDLLSLPHTQESFHHGSTTRSVVLDAFLLFADAFGTFRSIIVELKEHQSAAQVAIRHKDEARLASCVRSQKKTEKEMAKIASSLGDLAKSPMKVELTSGFEEAELIGLVREVMIVTASASASIFFGVMAFSSTTFADIASLSTSSKVSGMVGRLKRLSSSPSMKRRSEKEEDKDSRSASLLRLEEFEECIGSLESRSERVFRCLINTRVTLLNILTL